jgi:hypothetical protein
MVGTPVPNGARSSAGKFGPLSPLNRVAAVPEPSRFPTRIVPEPVPKKLAQ